MREKDLIDWVETFMKQNKLFASSGVVGLSGGADSLLLAHVLEALRERGHLKQLRHIHIDHGLRSNSGEQAFKLKKYALSRNWDFELIKITGSVPESNIESWARQERKEIFESKLEGDDVLYLGHHIDDSFEWFLRQTVGSSSSGHSHGIPLINGSIRRPFHCLTKKQITNFSKVLNLPIQIDQSNESLEFQRNAISKLVKGPLLKLFPKGLAHYVEHANKWASKEGVSCERPYRPEVPQQVWQNYIGKGVYALLKITGDQEELNNWSIHKEEIVSLISLLSNKGRGELRLNLEKLIKAAKTNGVRGPLFFSGGVKVYIYPGMLIFLGGDANDTIEKQNSGYVNASQIPCVDLTMNIALNKIESLGGAGLIVFEKENLFGLKGLKKDELFDVSLEAYRNRGLSIRPFSQLFQRAAKNDLLDQKFKGQLLF